VSASLLEELRRRKVFKVGAAYLVVAWLLIQVTATVAPQLARQLVTLEPFVRNFWSRVLGAAIPLDRGDLVREAEAHIQEIQPNHYDGIAGELQLHLAWGRVEQARAALAAAAQRAPALMADEVALMAWATRAPGASDTAPELPSLYAGESDPNVYAAMRGDADRVFASFTGARTSYEDRRFLFILLDTVPGRTLLGDPRAKKLLREFGFEAYWREKGWPALCRPLGSDDFECGAAAKQG
jgi:hypothetical protein